MFLSSDQFFQDGVKEIAIVGGGISGLISAYYLVQRGYKITLYERLSYLGGVMQSFVYKRENKEYYYDKGPRLFQCDGVLDRLCNDLGVEISYLPRKKFLLYEGQMIKNFLSSKEKVDFFYRIKKKIQRIKYDMTLYECMKIVGLGKKQSDLYKAIVEGSWGVLPSRLSAYVLFDDFMRPEKKPVSLSRIKGSSKKGILSCFSNIFFIKNGTASLINKLVLFLEQNKNFYKKVLHKNIQCNDLLHFDKVILCTSATESAKILFPYESIVTMLNQVLYTDMISVDFVIDHLDVSGLGLGFFEMHEGQAVRGCLFKNEKSFAFVTVFISGRFFFLSDKDIKCLAYDFVKRSLGVSLSSVISDNVNRWKDILPICSPQHISNMESLLLSIPKNYGLFSPYTGSLGINKIVRTAKMEFECDKKV